MSKTKRSMPRGPARVVLTLVVATGLVASGHLGQPAEAPSRALATSVAVTTQERPASSVQAAPRVQLSALVRLSAARVQLSARVQVSAPRITRTEDVRYPATVSNMQALLDRCDGSVAIRFSAMAVRLLAEHDYCGGRWILRLDRGEVIRVVGGGISGGISGIYRVNRNIKVVPTGSSAYVLRGMGDVVAQTCRADGDTLRLVGLSKLR